MLKLLHYWPSHWHHLLAHILDLVGNELGCVLFTSWPPDRRVSESAWTTVRPSYQMLQTPSDLSASCEQEAVTGDNYYRCCIQENPACATEVEPVI